MGWEKGISPLIAAVLLITFVIAIGALVSPFMNELVEDSQETTTGDQQQLLDHVGADVEIKEFDYNSSSGNYSITVQNTGGSQIENFTVTAHGDEIFHEEYDVVLEKGESHTFTFETDASTEEDRVVIEAVNLDIQTERVLE